MLAIGFDPAFIDTIVRAETANGELVEELPQPGYHHRRTKIRRVAGGNAVNIAYVLKKLGNELDLIIPSDYLFDKLLDEKNLSCTYRIHETVNETVAVSWKPGEIQFNQVIGEIDRSHFTQEIYDYWTSSEIQVSVNWGLNYTSHEWLSCLWLASCGWSYDEITEIDDEDLVDTAIGVNTLQNKLVLEPGSIQDHPQKTKLMQLLNTMATSSFNSRYPVFSCNEEENVEFADLEFISKLVHTSKKVEVVQNGKRQVIEVPHIDNIKTFVGAGDSFVAGIVDRLYHQDRLDPGYAISVAQRYMTNTL